MTTSTAQLHQVTQATSLKMFRPGIRPALSSTLVAILSLGQLAYRSLATSSSSSSNSSLSDTGLAGIESAPPPASLDETQPGELHFGAKVALYLLTATIALVAVATLVDYQTSADAATKPQHSRKRTGPKSRDSSANGHRLLFGKREPGGLRDYRSLSMSSSCSSSLFCYTNSVASSSVAHFGQLAASSATGQSLAAPVQQQADTFAQAAQASHECLAGGAASAQQQQEQHYESNIQLHLNEDQATNNNVNNACGKPLILNLAPPPPTPFCLQENNKPPAAAYHQSDFSIESPSSREQLVMSQKRRRRRAELAALAGQILLAFSLRHSARQIFGSCADAGEEPRRCAPSDKWSPDGTAPTLTLVNEQNNSHKISCDARQEAGAKITASTRASSSATTEPAAGGANTTSGPHKSIDSLHGLRFLSMIWVIVIHSYNFALRWMFFSNATTLDSIYKSAASQLIANGSFACDSFFFAGGFLLPYSAFMAEPAAQTQAESHEEAGSKTSAQASANNNKATTGNQQAGHVSSDQQVASPAPAAACERLESGGWCCSCNWSCCCACCSCCCSCCCYYCAQQRMHGCCRAGLAAAGASRDHTPAGAAPISDNISPSKAVEAAARSCQVAPLVSGACGGPHASQRPCCAHWAAQGQQQQQHRPASERGQNINELASDANCKRTAKHQHVAGTSSSRQEPLTLERILANILHRYVRMMPLMMAIIGLCASLLRYLGEGPLWAESTLMYDGWCRKNWWINAMFLHNFVKRENMCLSHSWYSAVDLQLFLVGQLVLFVLSRSRRAGLSLLLLLIGCSQVITMSLTLAHQLPAVPLVSSVDEQTMNLYYGEIYIKPYCRAPPYLIGILLAYLMRTTQLERLQLRKWQVAAGWTLSLGAFVAIILAMQPAMNGHSLSGLESALYSALSRPLWALATGWMIFACITKRGGLVARILGARCFVPLSKLTYPAFLVHPIVMALFYGSRQSSFHFSHYLMLYLILGNIVITYASAFILAALFELPMLSVERAISRRLTGSPAR